MIDDYLANFGEEKTDRVNYFVNLANECLEGTDLSNLLRLNGFNVEPAFLEMDDPKIPVFARVYQEFDPNHSAIRNYKQVTHVKNNTKSTMIKWYDYLREQWKDYDGQIAPNQFLNAMIWKIIAELNETTRMNLMNEQFIAGFTIGEIMNKQQEMSRTGIWSRIMYQYVSENFPRLGGKVNIGCGNYIRPNDWGIDLIKSANQRIICANASEVDYARMFPEYKTVCFFNSLHHMKKEVFEKIAGHFTSVVIQQPFNCRKNRVEIERLTKELNKKGQWVKDPIKTKIRVNYDNGYTDEHNVFAAIISKK